MVESRKLRVFFNSIKPKATLENYKYNPRQLIKFYKSFKAILEIEPKKLQEMIEDYVMQRKFF